MASQCIIGATVHVPGKEQYVVCRRQAQGLVKHGARTVGGSPAFRIEVAALNYENADPDGVEYPYVHA